MMKTISQVFVTGVKEITTTPALFGDVLEYEGKFYKVGTVRQEVKDTRLKMTAFIYLLLQQLLVNGGGLTSELPSHLMNHEVKKRRYQCLSCTYHECDRTDICTDVGG